MRRQLHISRKCDNRDGIVQRDIKNVLRKARNAFANLRSVWQSLVIGNQLLKRISIRLRYFTVDANAGSVGFSGPGPSQNYNLTPKQIPSQFTKKLKGVVSGDSGIFKEVSQ